MARKANDERYGRYKGLLEGIERRWAPGDRVTLLNQPWTVKDLADMLREILGAFERVDATRARLDDELLARRAIETKWWKTVGALEERVLVVYRGGARELGDFGLRDRKKTGPKTTEAKLVSAKKADATRAARGTRGKRQRKKTKGG